MNAKLSAAGSAWSFPAEEAPRDAPQSARTGHRALLPEKVTRSSAATSSSTSGSSSSGRELEVGNLTLPLSLGDIDSSYAHVSSRAPVRCAAAQPLLLRAGTRRGGHEDGQSAYRCRLAAFDSSLSVQREVPELVRSQRRAPRREEAPGARPPRAGNAAPCRRRARTATIVQLEKKRRRSQIPPPQALAPDRFLPSTRSQTISLPHIQPRIRSSATGVRRHSIFSTRRPSTSTFALWSNVMAKSLVGLCSWTPRCRTTSTSATCGSGRSRTASRRSRTLPAVVARRRRGAHASAE